MAAPEFVPTKPTDSPRAYASPPRYGDEWRAARPGEVVSNGGQPDRDAGRMGSPGPDQGYLLKLAPLLRPEVHVTDGELLADAEAGALAIALKRASLFGRAPVLHDLRLAYVVWGFLDASPAPELVAERQRRFEGVRLTAHHYPELRAVVDAVPTETIRLSPAQAAEAHAADWRSLLAL
ncbi:hypothetical protein KSP35_09960 [Aquihabitans sp. G128]|uniref:hypothetical protein n=1 Tax=Aquihabitans sp. G128 TaxID=2849779 RepID=UPI001C22392C|nr:hypothetical protein [Aquihabitans sp. G128]QXC63069.1 hypothetical protein KSP35_09960 [Aquihabitans sp. G128]